MTHECGEADEGYEECARIGNPVPDFSLKAFDPTEGGFVDVDLADIRAAGKWTVLVFYPGDFTFVCPTELADLAAHHEQLKALGCEVISVSTDSEFVHMAWHTGERLLQDVKFRMGADPTGDLSRFFDVWDPETGQDLRGTFVINPDGVLVASEVNFYNVGRNADELVRKLEANVYLRKNPNQACPAKWKPGDKVLTPGADLVGKVYEALNEERRPGV